MKKYKFNEEKFLRNFTIFSSGVTIGILIYKIATCGISFISTIRILRIERRKNMWIYETKKDLRNQLTEVNLRDSQNTKKITELENIVKKADETNEAFAISMEKIKNVLGL